MKWLVGVDPYTSSYGAVRFAEAVRARPDQQVVGLHVVDEKYLMQALRYSDLENILKDAEHQIRSVIKEAGVDADFELRVARGWEVDKALQKASEEEKADVIVVGRQAPSQGKRLTRLGRVTRLLLRHAQGPVVVCPRDYDPRAQQGGSVILALDAGEKTSGRATEFATQAAAALGVPLVACHVADSIDEYLAANYITPDALKETQEELRRAGERRLAAWMADKRAPAERAINLQGKPVEELVALAEREKPSLLVCGSRRLSTVERVFVSSVGSHVAAHAPCPVAVVPPAV